MTHESKGEFLVNQENFSFKQWKIYRVCSIVGENIHFNEANMKKQLFLKLCIVLVGVQLWGSERNWAHGSVSQDDALSVQPAFAAALGDVLKNFKRRITFLEIGREADYTFALSPLYKAIWVALLVEGGPAPTVERIKAYNIKNITVLAPPTISYETFFTLGRCEHFDVVFVHDISHLVRAAGPKYIDALIKLGDYVFIEASYTRFKGELKKKKVTVVAQNGESELYLSIKPKKSLDIPRYTQKDRPLNKQPNYFIKSSFTDKFFSKKGEERPIKWVDGINLVTFAMLRGAYPVDSSIRKQVLAMKKTHSKHNDLVLGNIIVQGDKLIPIDCTDSRRDADLHRCISSALRAFKEGNIRQKNPERWIREYYDGFN